MKKLIALLTLIVLCTVAAVIPASAEQQIYYLQTRLTQDLATRSGPGTIYTGCGSYKMKGQTVTALSWAYDKGGVLWVEVEFTYGGAYRRAWTGAKRLGANANQLTQLPYDEGDYYLGYGTVNTQVSPRFGPGMMYSPYGDRDFYRGQQVAVLTWRDSFYLVQSQYNGETLRSWIPDWTLDF